MATPAPQVVDDCHIGKVAGGLNHQSMIFSGLWDADVEGSISEVGKRILDTRDEEP